MPRRPSGRRERIGQTGLTIIASSGLHALTHRNVDAALAFPPGTTSYYARSRRELVALAVERLAARLDALPLGEASSVSTEPEAVAALTSAVELLLAEHGTDQLARLVLLIDLRGDPELHDLLAESPIQAAVVAAVETLLSQIGAADPTTAAAGLLALIDGLMLASFVSDPPAPVRPAIAAYVAGLPRVEAGGVGGPDVAGEVHGA